MPSVLIPIADGTEELELVSVTNPLARAGVKYTLASVKPDTLSVECSRGIKLTADAKIADVAGGEYDCVVLPGGMPGAQNFHECAPLVELLKKRHAEKKMNAAICASPAVVFAQNDLLNSKATCYPADKFIALLGDKRVEGETVVVDEHVVTSVGPGTALQFGLKLVSLLVSPEKAQEVADGMKYVGPI